MDEFAQDINRAITQLTAMERAIIAALPKGAAAGAAVLLQDAERLVPRRTGALAASAFQEPVDHDLTQATHRAGFRKFYALPVDRGHPIRTQRGGPVVGRARAARFMSDPVQRLRKGKIAKAVTETISADVAQELRRFYGR